MKCLKCGKDLDPSDNFCSKCGTQLPGVQHGTPAKGGRTDQQEATEGGENKKRKVDTQGQAAAETVPESEGLPSSSQPPLDTSQCAAAGLHVDSPATSVQNTCCQDNDQQSTSAVDQSKNSHANHNLDHSKGQFSANGNLANQAGHQPSSTDSGTQQSNGTQNSSSVGEVNLTEDPSKCHKERAGQGQKTDQGSPALSAAPPAQDPLNSQQEQLESPVKGGTKNGGVEEGGSAQGAGCDDEKSGNHGTQEDIDPSGEESQAEEEQTQTQEKNDEGPDQSEGEGQSGTSSKKKKKKKKKNKKDKKKKSNQDQESITNKKPMQKEQTQREEEMNDKRPDQSEEEGQSGTSSKQQKKKNKKMQEGKEKHRQIRTKW